MFWVAEWFALLSKLVPPEEVFFMIIKDSAQDDEDFIDGDSDGVGFSRSDVEVKSKACEDTCFESEGEVVWKELLP